MTPPSVPTESRHIVHIAATANGAAWMHQQLHALQQRGDRTTAIISGRGGSLEARLIADGIPCYVLDLDILSSRNAWAAARATAELARLLRTLRPDVVHYHLFPSIIIGRLAAWVADVPVRVSMIPGPYYLEAPALGTIDTRTAPFDSKVIASCEYTRTLYRRGGVAAEHLELIYYGQDASLYDTATADGARVRRELGIAPGRPVVGDVAYFYPPLPDSPFTPPRLIHRGIKGHDVLLKAVPHVLARVPDALFVLVGDGWGEAGAAYVASLRQLAEDLGVAGSVLFAGPRHDIPDTLMAFDVSVQCSLNENLGGSLESLLMARPLVASDVGGLPDAVRHEQTGLLVPPDDPVALGAAIVRLLLDRALAQRLGDAGQALALEQFTLHRTVDELDALYDRELALLRRADGGRVRGYRLSRSVVRAVRMLPWASRELLGPIRDALRPPPPAPRPAAPAPVAASPVALPSPEAVADPADPLPVVLPEVGPPARPAPRPPRVVQMAGGTENGEWLVQICDRLRDRGHDVSAIIGWPERSLAQRLKDVGVPYGTMELSFAPGSGRLRLLVYLLRMPIAVLILARQLRMLQVTVVHTHIFNTIIIGRLAAWLARVPCRISMVPGPLHLEAPFTRFADRLTAWMDHRVVAGCAATYEIYREMGLSAPHLQCIPYGVDATRFDPARADGDAARTSLGIAPDSQVIGLVAYFYPPRTDWQTPPHIRGRGMKGHDDFLEAACLVRERCPRSRFLLVGGGWGEAGEAYRTSLIARAADMGLGDSVIFTGHRSDIPDMLAAMDVAVQCSLTENYGGTIESLLMERPTVATRVGGMPETVQHEITGLLAPPSDPPALAAAIVRMLEDAEEGRRMARAGRVLMRERFDIEQTVAGIDALYAELPGAWRDAGGAR